MSDQNQQSGTAHTALAENKPDSTPAQAFAQADEKADGKAAKKSAAKPVGKKALTALAVLAVAVLGYAALRQNAVPKAADAIPVNTAVVSRGSVTQQLNTAGTLAARETVTVYSPVSAPVTRVNAQLGQPVTAGQLLVAFDTSDLAQQVYQAQLSYNSAHAQDGTQQLTSAQRDALYTQLSNEVAALATQRDEILRRQEEAQALLTAYQNESRHDRTAAETTLARYEIEIADAKSANNDALAKQLEDEAYVVRYGSPGEAPNGGLQAILNREALLRTDVDALAAQAADLAYQAQSKLKERDNLPSEQQTQTDPYTREKEQLALQQVISQLQEGEAGTVCSVSGVVTSLNVQPGGSVAKGGMIMTIARMDQIEVQVPLTRYDLAKVQPGQTATITTMGNTYTGRVESIDKIATAGSGSSATVKAHIILDAPDDGVYLGLEATVQILLAQKDNVVIAPYAAVCTDIDGTYCMVYRDGAAVRTEIETGAAGVDTYEIISGLAEGDVVITNPEQLADGQRVSAHAAQ